MLLAFTFSYCTEPDGRGTVPNLSVTNLSELRSAARQNWQVYQNYCVWKVYYCDNTKGNSAKTCVIKQNATWLETTTTFWIVL